MRSFRLCLQSWCIVNALESPGKSSQAVDELIQLFEDYLLEHRRDYSADERSRRFATFRERHAFVAAYNEEQERRGGASLALNKFADTTAEEMTRWLGWQAPSQLMDGGSFSSNTTEADSGSIPYPEELDWSRVGAVTPVKEQGTCGASWAFAATAAMESRTQMASKQLVPLSEQQLIDCTGKYHENGCNGGLMDGAYIFTKERGLCADQDYPYEARSGSCSSTQGTYCSTHLPKGCVTGFYTVPAYQTPSELWLQKALLEGPVSVALHAPLAIQLYSSGVLVPSTVPGPLNHAALVVGYGQFYFAGRGSPDSGRWVMYWKLKNSWGKDWGERGYMRLERGFQTEGSGSFRMLEQMSYPAVSPSCTLSRGAGWMFFAGFMDLLSQPWFWILALLLVAVIAFALRPRCWRQKKAEQDLNISLQQQRPIRNKLTGRWHFGTSSASDSEAPKLDAFGHSASEGDHSS